MPPFITRWKQSFALRPLLWIAPAVIGGCVLGTMWAQLLQHWLQGQATRDLPVLWLPFLLMVVLWVLCWRWQKYFLQARIAAALAIGCFFCGYGARRALPPANDVSQLVRHAERRARKKTSALRRVPVKLRGYVSATPRVGDYALEFPLKSTFVKTNGKVRSLQGNIWVQAPLTWDVEVGDFVQLNTGLQDLPKVGSATESNRRWRYVLNNCWSRVRLSKGDSWQNLPGKPPWRYLAAREMGRWRKWLLNLYQQRFIAHDVAYPRSTAKLMVAMVFGDGALRTPLPPLVRHNFRVAGLTHLLVASGTQVTLLVGLILGFFKWTGLRRWTWLTVMVVLPLLAFYALLAGGAASIWRAFLAGICVTVALLLGRAVDVLSLWCFAAAALLVIDPLQVFDLSFQLTFAATFGLIVIAPVILRLVRSSFKSTFAMGLASVAVYTLAAQLAILPLQIYHFERFSLGGIATNLMAIPLAGILVGSGIIGIAFSWLTPLNAWLTQGIFLITAAASSWEWLRQRAVLSSPWVWMIFYLALFALPAWEEWRLIGHDEWQTWKKRQQLRWNGVPWLRLLVWSVGLAAMVWGGSLFWRQQAGLRVAVLDVGQGECIVIQTPSGRSILIDGGSLSSAEHGKVGNSVIIPYLAAHGVRKLDAVLLTHADADHCNALDEVLKEVPVGLFLDGSGRRKPSGEIAEAGVSETDYWGLRQEMSRQKVPRKLAHAGQTLHLGDGVILQILAPLRPALAGDNNRSMVAKLIYGKTSILLTGDMEAEAEMQLVHRGVNLQCTVLKVAHHGSSTSSTAAFLQAANPAAAIISCGRYNPFGHPATSTLERLKKMHVPRFRTDLDGTIQIHSNGEKCWITTFR